MGRTLPFLFEGEFALLVVVLVLASTAVFTSLFSRKVSVLVTVFSYIPPLLPLNSECEGECERTFPLFLGIFARLAWCCGFSLGCYYALEVGFADVDVSGKGEER